MTVISTWTKVCTKCGETKSSEEYPKDKQKKDGRSPQCKACRNVNRRARYSKDPAKELAANREYAKANPEKVKAIKNKYAKSEKGQKTKAKADRRYKSSPHGKKRKLEYNRAYGPHPILDVQEMPTESLLEACGGVCQLCGGAPATCRDHDHETGLTRGMLCNRCNVLLGLAGDGRDRSKLTEAQLEYVSNPPAYRKG